MSLHQDLEQLLRRLVLNDEATVGAALSMPLALGWSGLVDAKTCALVRLAALIALQSSPASFGWSVEAALAAGATDEEVVGVIVAVAPVVGVARVSCASTDIASVMGSDIDLPDWE